MGFLERARSTRGRHQRARSTKIEEMPQSATGQGKWPAPKSKRKSIFPGLSANDNVATNTNASETPRPATTNARASFSRVGADDKDDFRNDQTPLSSGVNHFAGNNDFRFPSPALVNNNTKRTPPQSVAHLPAIPRSNSTTFSPGPNSSTTKSPPAWNRSVTDPVLSKSPPEALPKQANTWEHPSDSQPRPQIRKQKSAWKTLGSLFRGKQAKQPIPDQFYQIQPPSNDSLARSDGAAKGRVGVLDSPMPSPVAKEEKTVARVDSGNEMLGTNNLLTPTPATVFPPRSSSRKSENFFEPEASATKSSAENPRRTPRLDINIPEAGFDRYSIMFEKLLEPKVPLIERRQSKRSPLKEVVAPNEGFEGLVSPSGLQRSLTSPSLTRLPSLTIHVANSNRGNRTSAAPDTIKGPIAHRPRPPKRSMTAPIEPLSPLSQPSETTTPITARAVPLPESTTTASSRRCSIMSENSLPPTPNTATSLASSIDTTVFGLASTSSTTPPKAQRASMVRARSFQASPPPPIPTRSSERPPIPRNYPTGTERFNRQIVQVSVARQVSVSKARRRVADAVEAKQPLRPRVVELGKNRKSTLVMIEGGD